ncbi:hypothetical protein ACIQU4_27465 [Streptomyces sp. NPDC090741]|uniref:hypothetical protein n=1 Tax=Streptomyces sp. NPDC090741 TaxID=3365967 RepID=UPI00380ECB21
MNDAHRLFALPDHRRLDLTARYPHVSEQRLSDALEQALQRTGAACPRLDKRRGHLPTTAILGTDERWHLRLGNAVICSVPVRTQLSHDTVPARPGDVIHHAQHFGWWTNGHTYRVENTGRPGSTGWTEAEWDVTLTSDEQRPDLVPPEHRCQVNVHEGDWAPYSNGPRSSWRAQYRNEYIAAGGDLCHACRTSLAQHLDYDRHTHLIRGVLCKDCSTHITTCPHPAGCHWADYLNNPPASHLRRRYHVGGNRDDRKHHSPGQPAA